MKGNDVEMKFLERLYLSNPNNLAFTDLQTGCKNRNWLEYHKPKLQKKSGYIISTDINNLKKMNDNYGHSIGDKLICAFADLFLKIYHKKNEYVVRIGGDEFLIFTNREELTDNFVAMSNTHFSYGIAYKTKDDDIDSAIRRADIEMYKMKLKVHQSEQ